MAKNKLDPRVEELLREIVDECLNPPMKSVSVDPKYNIQQNVNVPDSRHLAQYFVLFGGVVDSLNFSNEERKENLINDSIEILDFLEQSKKEEYYSIVEGNFLTDLDPVQQVIDTTITDILQTKQEKTLQDIVGVFVGMARDPKGLTQTQREALEAFFELDVVSKVLPDMTKSFLNIVKGNQKLELNEQKALEGFFDLDAVFEILPQVISKDDLETLSKWMDEDRISALKILLSPEPEEAKEYIKTAHRSAVVPVNKDKEEILQEEEINSGTQGIHLHTGSQEISKAHELVVNAMGGEKGIQEKIEASRTKHGEDETVSHVHNTNDVPPFQASDEEVRKWYTTKEGQEALKREKEDAAKPREKLGKFLIPDVIETLKALLWSKKWPPQQQQLAAHESQKPTDAVPDDTKKEVMAVKKEWQNKEKLSTKQSASEKDTVPRVDKRKEMEERWKKAVEESKKDPKAPSKGH